MKKYYGWIILTGVLSGLILKDPCFGPVFGFIVSIVIGIPLFLFSSWILKKFIRSKEKAINRIILSMSICFIVALHFYLFQPPGWLVFREKIASPLPPSVKHIHSRWRYGLFDVPIYIKFKIDKADLDRIILDKKFKTCTLEDEEMEDIRENKWFNIKNVNDIEVYHKESGGYVDETLDYYLSEDIIYDPNSKQGFYLHFFWT